MSEEIYLKSNVPVFEAIYGEGFISLGGEVATLKMFKHEEVANNTLLDIGFGIGGMAHLLASKFNSRVLGVEVHSWMPDYARETAPKLQKSQFDFATYTTSGEIPFLDGSVDLAYSKGVLTNVKDKRSLFKEVNRLLKSNGKICLIDWLVPASKGPMSETLPMGDASHKETESTYKYLLQQAGFSEIYFEDVSEEYLGYVRNLDEKLRSRDHQEQYTNIINDNLRIQLIESNQILMASIENGQQLSVKIKANKSE
ncbi:MAG: methyltransferase domain-containing protein [Oligoflexales bacterium]